MDLDKITVERLGKLDASRHHLSYDITVTTDTCIYIYVVVTDTKSTQKTRGREQRISVHYQTRKPGSYQDYQSRSSSQQDRRETRGGYSACQSSNRFRLISEQP